MAKVDIKLPMIGYTRPAGFIAPTHDGPGLPCHIANASNDWRKVVEKHIERIPPAIRNLLYAQSVSVILAGRPTDIGYTSTEPDLGDYYQRSEVEIGAFYSFTFKAIVLPEYHKEQGSKMWVKLYQPEQVIAHEFAHALDDVLGIRKQPEAISAYTLDKVATEVSFNKDLYGYLLQKDGRGHGEAIAELGSLIWTGNNVSGAAVNEWDWQYSSCWMKVYLNEIKQTYDPAQGLSSTFRDAAAKKAEYAVLSKHIVKDNIGYQMMLDIAAKFRSREYDSDWLLSDQQKATKHAIKDIIRRQGDEAVETAFDAHREHMKTLRFKYG